MKKFVVTILMLILMLCFTSCSNRQVFDTNFVFTKAYVKIGEEWQDVKIKTWKDYEGEQLQLKLQDGTVLIVHAANCILYNGTLPQKI